MKVLQINSVCGYGSTGRIVTDIYNVLEKQGHSCLVAYGRGDAPKEINSFKIGNDFDNYMHVAMTRILDMHGFGSKRATMEFIKKAEEYNPDVIHIHNIHGYYINIEILFNYLKKVNKPIVWTLHDCWAFTGHCAYFDYAQCDKWKVCCNNCQQSNEYPKSVIVDNSKKNYETKKRLFNGLGNMVIVTPSIWLSDLVKQSFLKKYDLAVINNGINLDIFRRTASDFREKNSIKNKTLVLGVANIWDRRKGLEDFVKLSEIADEKKFKFCLVGLNKKQLQKIPTNIIGITRTNNIRELVEIYSAADIFFNPTYEDNYPTTNLEALSCGTPVVTYDTGGSAESILKSGNYGAIIPKRNYEDVLKIDKEKFVYDMKFKRKFSVEMMLAQYLQLYKNMIR